MLLERRDALTNEQSVAVGLRADEAYPAVGEVEHLRCARVKDELLDVLADELLGTDAHVDRDCTLLEQASGGHVLGRADASDLRRCVKKRVGDLAGDHVGFIGIGQGDDDVGVIGAGALEHVRISCVTDDGTDVEAVLQFAKNLRPHVDNGDFVGFFAREVIRGCRTNLTCAENEDFHFS